MVISCWYLVFAHERLPMSVRRSKQQNILQLFSIVNDTTSLIPDPSTADHDKRRFCPAGVMRHLSEHSMYFKQTFQQIAVPDLKEQPIF